MAEAKPGFQTPPEVTEFLGRKTLRPSFSFRDVSAEEHAYAFAVAKATELELLTLFKRSIGDALAKGQGLETWRQAILPELQRIGWGGPRLVSDPTGQMPDRMVNFTAPRRLNMIFWGNMAAARSAGQWQRIQRTKAVLPYLIYIRSASARPREQHLRWVGIILPADHPWWSTHFPPNAWNCKCSVRQIDGRERTDLLGREPASPDDPSYTEEIPIEEPRVVVNKRTGEVLSVPAGVDPSWAGNPGLNRAQNIMTMLTEKLAAAAPEDSLRVLTEAWSDPFLKIADRLPQPVVLPAGVAPHLAQELGTPYPVVAIGSDTLAKRTIRDRMPIEKLAITPRVIAEGIVLPDMQDGLPNVRNLVAKVGSEFWFAVVVMTRARNLRLRTIHPRAASRLRKVFEQAGIPWPWPKADDGPKPEGE